MDQAKRDSTYKQHPGLVTRLEWITENIKTCEDKLKVFSDWKGRSEAQEYAYQQAENLLAEVRSLAKEESQEDEEIDLPLPKVERLGALLTESELEKTQQEKEGKDQIREKERQENARNTRRDQERQRALQEEEMLEQEHEKEKNEGNQDRENEARE